MHWRSSVAAFVWSSVGPTESDGQASNGLIVLIQEARAEIGCAAAVDHRRPNHIGSFLQCEAPGNAVVDDRLPIVVDADDLFAIQPPYRGSVRADGKTHVLHLTRAVHNGDCPE